jgi:hypothetical protein
MIGHAFRRATWVTGVAGSIPRPNAAQCLFGGVLKDLVYKNKPRNFDELKDTIRDKVADISVELCRKNCLSVLGRVRECLARDGQNFGHYT